MAKTKKATRKELWTENVELRQHVADLESQATDWLSQETDLRDQVALHKRAGEQDRESVRADRRAAAVEWDKLRAAQKKFAEQKDAVKKDELAFRVGQAMIESRRRELEIDKLVVSEMREDDRSLGLPRLRFPFFPLPPY